MYTDVCVFIKVEGNYEMLSLTQLLEYYSTSLYIHDILYYNINTSVMDKYIFVAKSCQVHIKLL